MVIYLEHTLKIEQMKNLLAPLMFLLALPGMAQEKNSDTTRINLGEVELIVIKKPKVENTSVSDTIDAAPHTEDDDEQRFVTEGHWNGLDFGPSILMNSSFKSDFTNDPQWKNDPAKSFYWNINFFDRKFNLYKHYVGLTTGFGINFTQIGIKNNEVLKDSPDSLYFVKDTLNNYTKNKLRGTYLQVPLLLEFNTNKNESHSFYFATGVIAGVRVGSAVIQKVDRNGSEKKEKIKGVYGLNSFKLDATARLGYGNWGLFANYALLPLFDTSKTDEVRPFTFGLSYNF